MKDRIGAIYIAMAVVSIPLAHAQAACAASDLEGRWEAYAIGDDFGFGYWQRCSLRIDNRGRFRSGSKCRENDGDKSTLSSSDLRLKRSCILTGSLRQTFGGTSFRCDIHATLSADKQILSGVGECDDGDIFLFNMVRR